MNQYSTNEPHLLSSDSLPNSTKENLSPQFLTNPQNYENVQKDSPSKLPGSPLKNGIAKDNFANLLDPESDKSKNELPNKELNPNTNEKIIPLDLEQNEENKMDLEFPNKEQYTKESSFPSDLKQNDDVKMESEKNYFKNKEESSPLVSTESPIDKDEETKAESKINKKKRLSSADNDKICKILSPNLAFYLNKPSQSCPWDFEALLNKKGNYDFLEFNHSFIQWLFPNHFSSAFNSNSYALTPQEASLFRKNPRIAQNLLKAYDMIFDFYGLKFEKNEFIRSEHYKTRYYETIAYPSHNHLRIRRILAHLNVVGFREIAIKLINFLMEEVLKKDSGLGYIKNVVNGVWRKYGEIDENNEEEVMALLGNCFPKNEYYQELRDDRGRRKLLAILNEKSVCFF